MYRTSILVVVVSPISPAPFGGTSFGGRAGSQHPNVVEWLRRDGGFPSATLMGGTSGNR